MKRPRPSRQTDDAIRRSVQPAGSAERPATYECKFCGEETELPWTWPSATVCDKCSKPSVIKFRRSKAHAVFGHTHEGLYLTYCGLRWDGRSQPSKGNHCKHCTREMRKADMTWKWYEARDSAALPNSVGNAK